MKVHNVFHVSLLEPYVDNGKNRVPPPPVETEGIGIQEEFYLDKIIKHAPFDTRCTKTRGGRDSVTRELNGSRNVISTHRQILKYRCIWLDYPPEAASWVHEDALVDNQDQVCAYWANDDRMAATRLNRKRKMGILEPEFNVGGKYANQLVVSTQILNPQCETFLHSKHTLCDPVFCDVI
jgi:hypothetical protein